MRNPLDEEARTLLRAALEGDQSAEQSLERVVARGGLPVAQAVLRTAGQALARTEFHWRKKARESGRQWEGETIRRGTDPVWNAYMAATRTVYAIRRGLARSLDFDPYGYDLTKWEAEHGWGGYGKTNPDEELRELERRAATGDRQAAQKLAGMRARLRAPFTEETWDEFLRAKNRGERCEINEAIWEHFLGVLPPRYMNREVDLISGERRKVDFGFGEGADPTTAFWREGRGPDTRYFAQLAALGRWEAEHGWENPPPLRFVNDHRGYHHGQHDYTLVAGEPLPSTEPLGFVSYNVFGGEIHISMIEVFEHHRRVGVGRALLLELARLHPGKPIRPGWQTESGAALWRSVPELHNPHSHPHLARPVSRQQVERELFGLARRGGIACPVVGWSPELTKLHRRVPRRYAQVLPEVPFFELAEQTRWLDARHRKGLLAHEVGHVLADPSHVEADADEAARERLGVSVSYDRRWTGGGGRGLQVAKNPDEELRRLHRDALAGYPDWRALRRAWSRLPYLALVELAEEARERVNAIAEHSTWPDESYLPWYNAAAHLWRAIHRTAILHPDSPHFGLKHEFAVTGQLPGDSWSYWPPESWQEQENPRAWESLPDLKTRQALPRSRRTVFNPTQGDLFPDVPPPVTPPPLAPAPGPGATTPDLRTYDTVIVMFSGGKDSLASLIRVLELAREQGRDLVREGALELWHHDVDDPEAGTFMDWPITRAYVQAVARALGIPLYFSWKVGGFARELHRDCARTAPTRWEEPGGTIGQSGGSGGKLATRKRFPQVSADLSVRWCSAYLKIDVGASALRGQERFVGKRTLTVSGERAEESPGRARYKTLEPDRSNLPGKRHVDRWRPVHHWTTAQVWDAIRRWGIVPHPAYRAGFGRVSCAFCIFGSPDQWATLRQIMPSGFDRIAQLEAGFGVTIQRKETVEERAARGRAYARINADVEEGRRLAVQRDYDAPVMVSPAAWILPEGAFAEGAGPT